MPITKRPRRYGTIGGPRPTVTVTVPVPVEKRPKQGQAPQPQKSRAPVSFGPPPQAPQPAPAQPAPVPQQPVPGPRAIIFPWSPAPQGKVRQSRTGPKRYSSPHAAENGRLNPEQLGMAEQATASGDWTNWGALADHLQENGYPNTGDVIARVAAGDEGTSYDTYHHEPHVERGGVGAAVEHGGFEHRLSTGRNGPLRSVAVRLGNRVHVFRHRVEPLPGMTPPLRSGRRLPSKVVRYVVKRYGRLRTVGEYGGITRSFIDAIDNPPPRMPFQPSSTYEHPLILADFLQDEDDPRATVLRRAEERDMPHLSNGFGGRTGYHLRDEHAVEGDFGDLTFRVVGKGPYKRDARNKELVTEVGFPSPAHRDRGIHRDALTTPDEARAIIDAIPHEGHRAAAHAFLDKHFGPRTTVTEPAPMSRTRRGGSPTLPKKVIRFGAHDSLPSLLKVARQTPHDATLHGAIADALDEAHPGNKVGELIRRQYGLGQHAGNGELGNLYYNGHQELNRRLMGGAADIGTDGPFNIVLRHHGNTNDNRWVVHAISRLPGSRDSGYTFEFPHSEAHLIPQMFPGAAEHIDPEHPHPWGDIQRETEANEFNDRTNEAG